MSTGMRESFSSRQGGEGLGRASPGEVGGHPNRFTPPVHLGAPALFPGAVDPTAQGLARHRCLFLLMFHTAGHEQQGSCGGRWFCLPAQVHRI